jgi:hypothetical protein
MDVPHGDRQRRPAHDLAKRPRIDVRSNTRREGVPQTVEQEWSRAGQLQGTCVLFL